VARREDLDLAAARRRVQEVDAERARFTRKLYHAEVDASLGYDLVLNSDRLPVEGMVELVLEALRIAGLTTEATAAASR
jgi:cytidylate kinase